MLSLRTVAFYRLSQEIRSLFPILIQSLIQYGSEQRNELLSLLWPIIAQLLCTASNTEQFLPLIILYLLFQIIKDFADGFICMLTHDLYVIEDRAVCFHTLPDTIFPKSLKSLQAQSHAEQMIFEPNKTQPVCLFVNPL